MSNPSTIWTTLSLPLSPIGNIPFVFTDGATIVTDATHLIYTQFGAALSGSLQNYQLTVGGGVRIGYQDLTSVPGAATINAPAGRVKLAASQTSLVVTCNYCFANSIVDLNIETADATFTRAVVTPALGSFTITGNASSTGAVTMSFTINNVYTGP